MKQIIHRDALVDIILKTNPLQPNEEDFWTIAIVLTNGNQPIFAINGSLETIANHTVNLIKHGNINTKGKQFSLLTFQGDKAHWAINAITEAPNVTRFDFHGDIRKIFPTMALTTTIILDEQYVTPWTSKPNSPSLPINSNCLPQQSSCPGSKNSSPSPTASSSSQSKNPWTQAAPTLE